MDLDVLPVGDTSTGFAVLGDVVAELIAGDLVRFPGVGVSAALILHAAHGAAFRQVADTAEAIQVKVRHGLLRGI